MKCTWLTAVAGAALLVSTPALAGPTAERKGLTLDGAKKVIAAAAAEAKRNSTSPTGVIAVVDEGGNTLALERLDNTFPAGSNISIGKARTAALFRRPTKNFEETVNKGRTAMVALNDFTPLQGGEPIVVDGQVVGAVGVSGAASAARDTEIALAGAAALDGRTETSPVSHFDGNRVADAFARGAVLFDSPAANYAVHASRRTEPGKVEVHQGETDVIHVLEGQATFVTGGKVVGGKETAPGEIRGENVDGGEMRRLAPGDVVIVPAGTPHWFKEVSGPLLYYVVKVR